jgi:hypothetical protein
LVALDCIGLHELWKHQVGTPTLVYRHGVVKGLYAHHGSNPNLVKGLYAHHGSNPNLMPELSATPRAHYEKTMHAESFFEHVQPVHMGIASHATRMRPECQYSDGLKHPHHLDDA